MALIRKRYSKVHFILIGTKKEIDAARELEHAVPNTLNLTGQFNIKQLAALFKLVPRLVSMDGELLI